MFSLQRLWAIAWKELMVLFFNKVSRILIIVPPLAQIVIFGWAATMEVRNVSFAVLDRDRGLGAERVVGAVLGSPTFVRMVQVTDEAEMRKVMDKGDVLFTLVFDSNFSRDLEAGRNASMQILLDGRRSNAAQIACHYVTNITSSLLSSGAAPGVVVRNWFNPNLEFQWFFLPNLIGILTFMLGLVVTGLTVAREREVGTFDQLLVTPSTPTEIALAKLVPGCVTGLIHGTLFLIISVFGFEIIVADVCVRQREIIQCLLKGFFIVEALLYVGGYSAGLLHETFETYIGKRGGEHIVYYLCARGGAEIELQILHGTMFVLVI